MDGSNREFSETVARCVVLARGIKTKASLSEAETFALDVLRHYGGLAAIPVQLTAADFDTEPPAVRVRVPENREPEEYCTEVQRFFGDCVVIRPTVSTPPRAAPAPSNRD